MTEPEHSTPAASAPPGWYPAECDPPGTIRYWDGGQWVGGPVTPPDPPAAAPVVPSVSPADLRLASPWARIGARLIDGLIVFVPTIIVLARTGYLDAPAEASGQALVAVLLIGTAGVLYEVGFIATRGATPGKMVAGVAVVRPPSLEAPGWGVAVRRWAINLVAAIPVAGQFVSLGVIVVCLVMLFADRQRRTLWDRIAGTRVIAVR